MSPSRTPASVPPAFFLLSLGWVLLLYAARDESLFQSLELLSLDARHELLHSARRSAAGMRAAVPTRPTGEVVVVEIDDLTVATASERLPPGRRRQAELLDRLSAAGARIIGMDFSLHGRSDLPEQDLLLREAIQRSGRVIYGKQWMAKDGRWWSVPNLGYFAEVMRAEGSVVVENDSDGRVRRFPLFSLEDGRFLPSFALVLLIHYWDLKYHQIVAERGELVLRPAGTERRVALDAQRGMLLDLARPEYPYRTVLYRELEATLAREPDLVRDRIVLVGSTARSSNDYHAVRIGPLDPGTRSPSTRIPGVHLHALAVHHLLTGSGFREAGPGIEPGILLLLGIVGVAVVAWGGLQIGMRVLFAMQIAYTGVCLAAFVFLGLCLPLVVPVLLLLLLLVTSLGVLFRQVQHDRQAAEAMISGYLSPRHLAGIPVDGSEVAASLMAVREVLAPAGYNITDMLGQGGMAVVFKATHERLGRPVALKFISPRAFQKRKNRERFLREAQLAGSLIHPNVVMVFDSGENLGVPFIAMELVEGIDLRLLIERLGRLDVPTAVTFIKEILSGLAAIHTQGIVHRDIKSANVLVSRDGRVKITDFGIARAHYGEGMETTQGMLLGTPAYVAPELIHGEAPTRAADLYSVGIVLHELLTGSTPFRGDSIASILKKQLADPVPDAGIAEPALAAVHARLLAKEPRDRYDDAEAVIAAIAGLLPPDPEGVLRRAAGNAMSDRRPEARDRRSEDTTAPVTCPD